MNIYENVNVTGDLRRAFETAALISVEMDDLKIRSAYLLLALLHLGDTTINKFYFEEYGLALSPTAAIKEYLTKPEVFSAVFGEEACKKYFEYGENKNQSEETSQDTEDVNKEEESNKIDDKVGEGGNIRDITRAEVKKVLDDLMLEEELKKQEDSYVPNIEINYSDKLETALNDAALRCKAAGNCMDVDNVLYSLLKNEESSAYKTMLAILNILEDVTMKDLLSYMEQNSNIYTSDLGNFVNIPMSLESCCENFNKRFTKGEKSEILGRDKKKKQLWNIFSKKTKSNAILIGEPGVGKTAIIEAITQDIVNEECPKRFLGYTVISFDVSSAVAGTKYRGEFETKICNLKKLIEKTPKVILFIDEIHMTLGAGSTEGNSNDLSGALKSTLARDNVIVVGTTTSSEYDVFINSDEAFKRRFETVKIKEPKHNEVKAMVSRKIEGLEKFHNVKLEEGLLEYMITASSCFNSNSSNPDRTLDLADRTMSIAENLGDSVVTREHIKKVFEEAYDDLDSMEEITKETVAYHEAGHYVVSKLTTSSDVKEVTAISIIPTDDYLGANILEEKKHFYITSKINIHDEICTLLGGRAAEEIIFKSYGIGASNDLQRACLMAKNYITLYGLDDDFKNLSFVYDKTSIIESSEKIINEINKKISEIISNKYEWTTKILENNKKLLDLVANALLEKSLLTKEDLDVLYDEYMSSRKSE